MFDLDLPKYIFSYINEENDGRIFDKALNKSIKFGMIQTTDKSDVLLFNLRSYQPHEFKVIKRKISLDQRFISFLKNLILQQFEISKMIPTEEGLETGNYRERFDGHIEAIIHNLVYYKWSYNEDNISVLDMAADIMYRIAAINHPFSNGNKRTALLSTGTFLDAIGLYLYFYRIKNKTIYLEKWKDFMLEVAKSKELNKTEEETLNKIKNKLSDSIWINLENEIMLSKKIEKESSKDTLIKEAKHEEIQF